MQNGLLLRWLINAGALWMTGFLLGGVSIDGIVSLLLASLTLGILNALVRPILLLVTLPLTVVTLGLFIFVVNAVVLKLAAAIVGGFVVSGFWTAIAAALLLSVFNLLLSALVTDRHEPEYVYIRHHHD